MKFFQLIHVLHRIRLLTPLGIYRLITAIHKYGLNLMTLLCIAGRTHTDKPALVDDTEILTYKELLSQTEKLAIVLKEKYQIKKGQKVGFLCKNHASLVKAIFASSLLGADIYLLNAEMSQNQLNKLLNGYDFDYIIYDNQLSSLIAQSKYTQEKILSYHETLPAINNLINLKVSEKSKLQRNSTGKLVLLTGGTTGDSKTAAHKPSLFNFLNPFKTLLTKLNLTKCNNPYIATPIYHGYGIAVLFLFMALGKKMIISNSFDPNKACRLIREHKVEVITVVPLMINKMLKTNPEDLKSLTCIVSGGALLNPKLVGDVFNKLGDVLYNLYGTSEAGLNIIATPQDLRYSPNTIGKKINGVQLKILDGNKNKVELGTVGQFCIKNAWSMGNSKNPWIETGDLGYQDNKGYYFLCGRVGDMVVSAGENVYPAEIEKVLINHPLVEDVAIIGVSDEDFGQRLKAFVHLFKDVIITEAELFEWLKPRVARFQMPKNIIIVNEMPYTPLGKHDKKQLRMKG